MIQKEKEVLTPLNFENSFIEAANKMFGDEEETISQ